MTRTDFESLALRFYELTHDKDGSPVDFDPSEHRLLRSVVGLVADECQTQNQCFDRTRFLAACGLGGAYVAWTDETGASS